MSIHNQSAYKVAKDVIKDYPTLINKVDVALRLFSPKDMKYIQVRRMIKSLTDTKTMLQLHLETANKVFKSKGRVE